MKKKTTWKTIVATLVALFHIIPIYITLVASVKEQSDFSSYWIFPKKLFFENYSIALNSGGMLLAFRNTIIITLISVVLIVFVGAMASYPLSRNNTKINVFIMTFVLAIMMVPPLSLLVPLYSFMAKLKGISTFWGIIVVHVTFQLPLSIFLYTNFIKTIPLALDEAATIDGCSNFSIFYRIILPLLKPITATVIILTGVNIWNDYQFSLYFLQNPNMKVVTLAISSFFAMTGTNLNAAAASAIMGILPISILYIALQKYFVKGMVDSAVK
ncbi:carbohydrate ABC transporter permease [Clostridium grantii]|uniref:Carbohydrate ABC transporter membrane protein 2, CUT1 family n=1 Tax=Clostridium grantii DSM 8605 TaxID=1121316 RepID=A0A1M5TM29_9CLOT|nr:carbohydrate ABC transporter permease [Clostridium grantii]SHH51700.1 carbohydrate ABC transporter membrane protein 2, CUT1 family [Clostridium grantii DSM 8605]